MPLTDTQLLAAVAEAIQKGMAGPLKAMNEQGEEIRRLQGQITALRIESKQSPSEGDGDRGARNKRARPPSAPTSPRERMQRGEWCLNLNPFDVDNIKELTSAWGCASKLTLFLAGRRLTLLLEGASNPESNFHSLKAIVAFAHSQNLGVPCPELQASPHAPTTCTRPDAPAAHADAPSLCHPCGSGRRRVRAPRRRRPQAAQGERRRLPRRWRSVDEERRGAALRPGAQEGHLPHQHAAEGGAARSLLPSDPER